MLATILGRTRTRGRLRVVSTEDNSTRHATNPSLPATAPPPPLFPSSALGAPSPQRLRVPLTLAAQQGIRRRPWAQSRAPGDRSSFLPVAGGVERGQQQPNSFSSSRQACRRLFSFMQNSNFTASFLMQNSDLILTYYMFVRP